MHSNDTPRLCACGCGVPAHPRGRYAWGGRPCKGTPEQRFWARVEKSDGCWLWIGVRKSATSRYGRFVDGDETVRAHRRAWEMVAGPIPEGLDVLHTCDDGACVRNDEIGTYEIKGRVLPRHGHLYLGTHDDNMKDRQLKGRVSRKSTAEFVPRGEKAPAAKLTDDAVREIRRLGAGGWTHRRLAAHFGVDHRTIGRIVCGKGWTHVV